MAVPVTTAMAIGMTSTAYAEPSDHDAETDASTRNPDADLPPGVHRERRLKRWPLLAGGLAFGVPYVLSVTTAGAFGDEPPVTWLNVPVVGPWIFVAQWKGAFRGVQGDDNPLPGFATLVSDFVLILDGAAQATGLVFLAYGAASHETVVVDDAASTHSSLRVTAIPTIVGRGAPGLGLVGTF